jgi:hypothetical protein
MPVSGYSEKDIRIWNKALNIAKEQMIAKGWNVLSKKFNENRLKKAHKVYYRLIQT